MQLKTEDIFDNAKFALHFLSKVEGLPVTPVISRFEPLTDEGLPFIGIFVRNEDLRAVAKSSHYYDRVTTLNIIYTDRSSDGSALEQTLSENAVKIINGLLDSADYVSQYEDIGAVSTALVKVQGSQTNIAQAQISISLIDTYEFNPRVFDTLESVGSPEGVVGDDDCLPARFNVSFEGTDNE